MKYQVELFHSHWACISLQRVIVLRLTHLKLLSSKGLLSIRVRMKTSAAFRLPVVWLGPEGALLRRLRQQNVTEYSQLVGHFS